MKFGYLGGFLVDNQNNSSNNQFLQYRTQNGVPDQLTENINRFWIKNRVRYDAFYGQEQWTLRRVTVQGALRFDHAWSWYPEVQVGGVRFLPNVITYPETKGVDSYKDLSPRGGLAWDVFGAGRTSLKVNAGKYLEAAQNSNTYVGSRPTSRLQTMTTRSWTDSNNNFVPDCDLLNPLAQNLTASGGDVCAQISNLAFGQAVFDTSYDPALLNGWSVRPADWNIGVSVQQQLLPRVSVEAGYQRRWLTNFVVTDNLAQAPSDFGRFSIVVPADPRLPTSGQTIGDLFNANQNVASSVSNLFTKASNYGSEYHHSDGILINLTARPGSSLFVQGGINTGKTVSDVCDARAQLPELNAVATAFGGFGTAAAGAPTVATINSTIPWCHVDTGWVTRVTALGSWMIPIVKVQLAGTLRSDQGGALAALYAVPNAVIQPILGRPLSNAAPNVTVNLIPPGTYYGDRVNEIDVRFARILRYGRTRTNVGVDVYNIVNSSPVLTYNQNFTPNPAGGYTWLTPTSVLQPRFFKLSATIDF
jgi:hypothetical protein